MKWLEISYNTNANKQKKVFQGRPNWNSSVNTKSNWHSGHEDLEFFFNLETVNDNTYHVYTQYGQNLPIWGSTRFYKQEVKIEELEKLDDNSVKVKIKVTPMRMHGRRSDGVQSGYPVNYSFSVNGQTFDTFSANTADSINKSYDSSKAVETTITLKPQEQSLASAIKVVTTYPQGQYGTRTFYAGFALKNTLTANYVPMSIRQNGKWRALNKEPKGFIARRRNHAWWDRSEEQTGTSMQVNKGKNRIRQYGKWRQLPPMT